MNITIEIGSSARNMPDIVNLANRLVHSSEHFFWQVNNELHFQSNANSCLHTKLIGILILFLCAEPNAGYACLEGKSYFKITDPTRFYDFLASIEDVKSVNISIS